MSGHSSKGARLKLIFWGVLITVGFVAAANHFNNLKPTALAGCSDTSSCGIEELVLYGQEEQQDLHWATACIILAVISGSITLTIGVSFIQDYIENGD